MMEKTLPEKLQKGDKVAIIATSAGIKKFPAVLEKGLEVLEKRFNLEPVVYTTANKSTDYLNENPEEKAKQLMKAFEDPEIKGVIPVTGGDEQLRVLKYLEPERLKQNPTRFYGMSDNTNIHIYLQQIGLQSFYGGQILADLLPGKEIAEYTFKHLEKAFFSDSLGTINASEKFSEDFIDLEKEKITDDRKRLENPGWDFWNFSGPVSGELFGGCFEIIDWMLTADKINQKEFEGNILALETSEEAPSETQVKRWLMCMGERGFLQKFEAIIIGRPIREPLHGEKRTLEEKKEYHEKQKNRIKKEIKRYCPDTPVVFDMDFGHTDPKIPLQLGKKAALKPEKEQIEFK